jgi:hypothetical protein
MFGGQNLLIKRTLPDDARRILKACFEAAGDSAESIAYLNGLEGKMHQHASNQQTPFGISILPSFHDYQIRCEEFDQQLRRWLHDDVGPRLDPQTLSPVPVTDSSLHEDLVGACKNSRIELQRGFADAVDISPYGRASASRKAVLRLSKGEIFMDVVGGQNSFHVARFVAADRKISPLRKFAVFVEMIKLLHRTARIVTGKVATKDDPTIHLDGANWRFEKEPSIWGFDVSRLERFWLRAGAVPMRVLRKDGDPKVIALLREDEVLNEIEKARKANPTAPSPWHYASVKGIYGREILGILRMKQETKTSPESKRMAA